MRESGHPAKGQVKADCWEKIHYFVRQRWFDLNLWQAGKDVNAQHKTFPRHASERSQDWQIDWQLCLHPWESRHSDCQQESILRSQWGRPSSQRAKKNSGNGPPIPLHPKQWRGQNFVLLSYVQAQTRSNMNNGVYTASSFPGSQLVSWWEVGTMLCNIYLFDVLIHSFSTEDTVIFKKVHLPRSRKIHFPVLLTLWLCGIRVWCISW